MVQNKDCLNGASVNNIFGRYERYARERATIAIKFMDDGKTRVTRNAAVRIANLIKCKWHGPQDHTSHHTVMISIFT